ncbi:MAG: YhcH/YjgK/YiaL family protein [Bilifractor sp.]|nr:YhcH/YjgK/YiaL family protein [Lachnospiraceae bacterium]MDY2837519.1 YhcH/YjgK/YiaL family protein [Bilifractor sp.]
MLTTTIDIADKYNYLTDRFRKAFDFLKNTDFSSLSEGVIPIDGDCVFAQVQIYETKPVEECRFEAHRKYFDIQYMADGEEYMGFLPLKYLEEDTSYDAENDLQFYHLPEKYGRILLRTGDFAVVSPDDGHMPRGIGSTRQTVKKIVVKVAVD